MENWEQFDHMVKEDIDQFNADQGLLKARITVLLAKNNVSLNTVEKVRQLLLVKYNVEYNSSDIEEELVLLQHELKRENLGNDVVELEEDYFEGY